MDKKEVIANAIHRIDVEDYDRQSSIEQMYNDVVEKACEWLTNYFVYEHFGMTPQGCGVFCNKFKQAMEE